MRDRDHCFAHHRCTHRFLDDLLAVAVEGTGRFIEQQDGSVAQNRPGNRNSLSLAAGQLDSALANQSLIAVLQLENKLVGMRTPGGGHDLLVRGTGSAVADVLDESAVEEAGVLGNKTQGGAAAVLRYVPEGLPVDANRPGGHIMQTHQQAHQRRLASAARTHQPHSLRRRNTKLEVFDDVARPAPRRVIRESHAFKMNRPFLNHQCRSPGAVLDGRRNDQSVDALSRSSEMLVKVRYPLAEIVSRLQKRGGQRRDHDEIAGTDRATYPYIQRSPTEP